MEVLPEIAGFIVFVCVVVGLILFFSPIIIICRLGRISAILQEINKKMEGRVDERGTHKEDSIKKSPWDLYKDGRGMT